MNGINLLNDIMDKNSVLTCYEFLRTDELRFLFMF